MVASSYRWAMFPSPGPHQVSVMESVHSFFSARLACGLAEEEAIDIVLQFTEVSRMDQFKSRI